MAMVGAALVLCLLMTSHPALGAEPGPRRGGLSDPLPIQDNELIIGTSAGVVFVTEQVSPSSRDILVRIGGEHDVFVGFMNRALSWLDVEIALGLDLLWLAEDGFRQDTPRGDQTRNVLVGFHARGTVRVVPLEGASPTVAVGLVAGIINAPGEGFGTRVLLEAALGAYILQTVEHHLGLEAVYAWPFFDGLQNLDGSPYTEPLHRVLIRFTWGF